MINWQQFGLKGNPYDTMALTEGGNFPMETAFVGRKKECKNIDGLLESENRLALAVCGSVGVGKTSLANYEKYHWKKKNDKQLFSFRREIEASEHILDKRNFLIEIIASVIREIQLLDPGLLKKEPFHKFNQMVDFTQNVAFSASLNAGIEGFGGGVGFSKDASYNQPAMIPVATIEGYFRDVVKNITSHKIGGIIYKGLIVHMNNFDIVLRQPRGKDKVSNFFEEIRDVLQMQGVYYVFLGPKTFYQDVIEKSSRVKSIFSPAPLFVEPLNKKEVVDAFEERMLYLKSKDVRDYIKPVQDDVVFRLYDLYEGDIRSIMTALCDLLGQYSDKLGKQLSLDEALSLLGRERWTRIEGFGSTQEQRNVLKYIVMSSKEVSQKEISTSLGKQASNVSSYYVRPLVEKGVLKEVRKEGRTIFYGLTQDYEPLRWFIDGRQKVAHTVAESAKKQISLFSEGN